MKNSIGTNVILTVWGESHGQEIGAVLDGMPGGIPVDESLVAGFLERRRPCDTTDTARREPDNFRIASGVFNGYTTGAPISIIIPNEAQRSSDYEKMRNLPRPSHADYAAHIKYSGYEDYRGGGHFSGRVTAGIVAAGAIAAAALAARGIAVGTHILRMAGISDRTFIDIKSDLASLDGRLFPVLDETAADRMREAVSEIRKDGDSAGGVVQTAITGLPAGVGEPWFDSLEGMISKAVFAIGGVKGIEFGDGFGLADMRGSEANDSFCIEGSEIRTRTNHNGGINGGISNGMPVVFNVAVKPTPSISKVQQTVDVERNAETELVVQGRHDPAIVRRICIVVTSITAITLCDALAMKFGSDYFRKSE